MPKTEEPSVINVYLYILCSSSGLYYSTAVRSRLFYLKPVCDSSTSVTMCNSHILISFFRPYSLTYLYLLSLLVFLHFIDLVSMRLRLLARSCSRIFYLTFQNGALPAIPAKRQTHCFLMKPNWQS